MIRTGVATALALAAGFAIGQVAPDETPGVREPCQTGETVAVWAHEPTPCDLDGSNRLVVYGLDVLTCEDRGGIPVIRADGIAECDNVDN
jgi:hypothetical protein